MNEASYCKTQYEYIQIPHKREQVADTSLCNTTDNAISTTVEGFLFYTLILL